MQTGFCSPESVNRNLVAHPLVKILGKRKMTPLVLADSNTVDSTCVFNTLQPGSALVASVRKISSFVLFHGCTERQISLTIIGEATSLVLTPRFPGILLVLFLVHVRLHCRQRRERIHLWPLHWRVRLDPPQHSGKKRLRDKLAPLLLPCGRPDYSAHLQNVCVKLCDKNTECSFPLGARSTLSTRPTDGFGTNPFRCPSTIQNVYQIRYWVLANRDWMSCCPCLLMSYILEFEVMLGGGTLLTRAQITGVHHCSSDWPGWDQEAVLCPLHWIHGWRRAPHPLVRWHLRLPLWH